MYGFLDELKYGSEGREHRRKETADHVISMRLRLFRSCG